MKVAATFCPESMDPFKTVEWDYRSASIKDENGKTLFELPLDEGAFVMAPSPTNGPSRKPFPTNIVVPSETRSVSFAPAEAVALAGDRLEPQPGALGLGVEDGFGEQTSGAALADDLDLEAGH